MNYSRIFSVFKRALKKSLMILSLLVLTSCNLLTPKPTPIPQELGQLENGSIIEGQFANSQYLAARRVIEQAPGEVEVYANKGVIQSVITGSTEVSGQTPEARIRSYFDENVDLYQIGRFGQTFIPINQFDQANGVQVRQYQQVIGGVPVYQADIRVLLDADGKIALVNSNYMPDFYVPKSLKPNMNPTDAVKSMQSQGFVLPEGEVPNLVIYSPVMVGEVERSFLAWVAKAGWDGGFGDVLIKDSDGSLVLQSTDILTFSYEISDCGGEVYSSDHLPTSDEIATKPKLASSGSAILETMNQERIGHLTKHFSFVFELYEKHFGYHDYLTSDPEVQVLIDLSYKVKDGYLESPFYWRIDDKSVPILIAFPDPDFEDSIDVIAHEFQHSVTEDFVELRNTDESRALHESFSDFFAALADTSEFRWQVNLGKTIYRDVANPLNSKAIFQGPDHVSGFINGSDPHQNGLIFAHALYLLSEGGQKRNIKVLGIGIENVAQIVFRSLALLNNNATFQQARNAMVLTCENMVHEGNIPEYYCHRLKNALAAVGIGVPGFDHPIDIPPSEVEDNDEPVFDEAQPIEYWQFRFDHPMSPGLYLTYDTAKWEIKMDYYLALKEYPDCRVADYGALDSSSGEGDRYRYEEFSEFVGGIEYLLEKRIINETGISDAMMIYFDKNGNYWKYAFRLGFSPEIYDECLAAFWEVMELSRANNFSEVPGLAP